MKSPGLDPQYHISPALGKQKQEKFKTIFGYIMNLRLHEIRSQTSKQTTQKSKLGLMVCAFNASTLETEPG